MNNDNIIGFGKSLTEPSWYSIPKDIRKFNILPYLEMTTLCSFGATNKEHAILAIEEINRRYPSLLRDAPGEIVKAVLYAKVHWPHLKRGREMLLLRLKKAYPQVINCQTLSKAITNTDVIAGITELRLKNITNLPMDLPSEIGLCVRLRTLHLCNTKLRKIPLELARCTNLTVLNLSSNQFETLPPVIWQCTSLTYLNVGTNQLKEIPPAVGKLINLQTLRVNENPIKDIPEEIILCKKIASIDVHGTLISKISIKHLKQLLPHTDISIVI